MNEPPGLFVLIPRLATLVAAIVLLVVNVYQRLYANHLKATRPPDPDIVFDAVRESECRWSQCGVSVCLRMLSASCVCVRE
jgi:hypothetical protein